MPNIHITDPGHRAEAWSPKVSSPPPADLEILRNCQKKATELSKASNYLASAAIEARVKTNRSNIFGCDTAKEVLEVIDQTVRDRALLADPKSRRLRSVCKEAAKQATLPAAQIISRLLAEAGKQARAAARKQEARERSDAQKVGVVHTKSSAVFGLDKIASEFERSAAAQQTHCGIAKACGQLGINL